MPNHTSKGSKGGSLAIATIVTYVKQIADALQYAHDEKLIHRDIKPENMLVGRRNEILLSDFGIALVAQSSRYQSTQDVIGTVVYMSPEQIQGKPRPASDQYSLGIVVYEWLCGDRPFHGSFTELCAQHMFASPPPLGEKVPSIPPDVERVVLTALAKDPKQRFATVQAFATALEQASQTEPSIPVLIQSNPVSSQPIPPPASTILVSPVTPVQKPNEMGTPAVQPLPPTVLARAATSPDAQTRPQLPTGKHPAPKYHPALRSQLTRRRVLIGLAATGVVAAGGGAIWWVIAPHPLYVYRGHSGVGGVTKVAWSPDGKRIASGSLDNTVQVWDAGDGGNVFTYKGHSSYVDTVAWSPDGKRIASGFYDETVQVWDAGDGGNAFTDKGHSSYVHAVAWSLDGKRIASGSYDETVQVWDAVDGGNVFTYKGYSSHVDAVTWSPDSKRIASGSLDNTVQVWNAGDGGNAFIYKGHSGAVWAVAWSPDGKRIASGSNDGKVQVWVAS